ncbi:unnamed protein product [Onchocerca flexuosa]|uniref:ATP-dependent DNA helicase n=1 Tax=Onchocerca flexuosa TaxID=387005 RepID=A0A183H6H0_9BILA|nr:unnamed protein product [Onchocerca flexuosa]
MIDEIGAVTEFVKSKGGSSLENDGLSQLSKGKMIEKLSSGGIGKIFFHIGGKISKRKEKNVDDDDNDNDNVDDTIGREREK